MDVKKSERHDEHALVSPSSLARTAACPASLMINKNAGSNETAYTLEGTRAHMVAEYFAREALGLPAIMKFEEIPDKTKEMVRYGMDYAKFAYMIKATMEATSSLPVAAYCERKVSCEPVIPECWGTADLMFVGSDRISVADYKFGANKVEVLGNFQLKAYALGAYLSLTEKERAGVTYVDTYIFQPRANFLKDGKPEKGYFGVTSYSVKELFNWAKVITPTVLKAIDGVDERLGGDHCMFCAAKGSCEMALNYKKDFKASLAAEEEAQDVSMADAYQQGGDDLDTPTYSL